ncbi:MAG: hypothetical protein MUF71_00490 [Candidatus Kapabacteria bacterium]|nr:hypothetical protein [Candidatus Kapabacteria bacterium]
MKSTKEKAQMLKPFEKWNIDQLKKQFGLQSRTSIPLLEAWMTSPKEPLSMLVKQTVLKLQEFLRLRIDYWNEEELKFKFIGPLIATIPFDTEEYSAFLDRKLPAELNGEKITGIVDFMVATGRVEPQEPFFFLHEYKKARGSDNDPLGQLLIAMYAAQTLNSSKHPMYGCFVVGRNWFFVVLDGLEYATSRAFDATEEDDVFQIIAILQQAKNYIDEILSKPR